MTTPPFTGRLSRKPNLTPGAPPAGDATSIVIAREQIGIFPQPRTAAVAPFPAGHVVVAFCYCGGNMSGFVDARSNTWVAGAEVTSINNIKLRMFTSVLTTAIQVGDLMGPVVAADTFAGVIAVGYPGATYGGADAFVATVDQVPFLNTGDAVTVAGDMLVVGVWTLSKYANIPVPIAGSTLRYAIDNGGGFSISVYDVLATTTATQFGFFFTGSETDEAGWAYRVVHA